MKELKAEKRWYELCKLSLRLGKLLNVWNWSFLRLRCKSTLIKKCCTYAEMGIIEWFWQHSRIAHGCSPYLNLIQRSTETLSRLWMICERALIFARLLLVWPTRISVLTYFVVGGPFSVYACTQCWTGLKMWCDSVIWHWYSFLGLQSVCEAKHRITFG